MPRRISAMARQLAEGEIQRGHIRNLEGIF